MNVRGKMPLRIPGKAPPESAPVSEVSISCVHSSYYYYYYCYYYCCYYYYYYYYYYY